MANHDDVSNAITQMQNADRLDAMAETDALLMSDALGEGVDQLPDLDGNRDPEQISGWDGEPLGLDEIAETNLSGFQLTDRPLQTAHDVELSTLEQEINQLRAQNQQLYLQANPDYQARMYAERERQVANLYADPHGALNRMAYLEQQAQGGVMEALNTNLAAAHRQYGRNFEKAYSALTGLDPTSEVDRATVRTVLSQQDPGRSVMEWYSRSSRAGMGSGGGPPFARGIGRARSSDTGGRGPEDMSDWGDSGSSIGGGEEYEKDLMASMWRD